MERWESGIRVELDFAQVLLIGWVLALTTEPDHLAHHGGLVGDQGLDFTGETGRHIFGKLRLVFVRLWLPSIDLK